MRAVFIIVKNFFTKTLYILLVIDYNEYVR